MTNLLKIAEKELNNVAYNLMEKVYDENDLLLMNKNVDLRKILDKKYLNYATDIQLRRMRMCALKFKKKKIKFEPYANVLIHKLKYIKWKKNEYKEDLSDYSDLFAKEIYENFDKYKNLSLFEIIPKLYKTKLKVHNDSIDYLSIFYLLNKSCKRYKYQIVKIDNIEIRKLK